MVSNIQNSDPHSRIQKAQETYSMHQSKINASNLRRSAHVEDVPTVLDSNEAHSDGCLVELQELPEPKKALTRVDNSELDSTLEQIFIEIENVLNQCGDEAFRSQINKEKAAIQKNVQEAIKKRDTQTTSAWISIAMGGVSVASGAVQVAGGFVSLKSECSSIKPEAQLGHLKNIKGKDVLSVDEYQKKFSSAQTLLADSRRLGQVGKTLTDTAQSGGQGLTGMGQGVQGLLSAHGQHEADMYGFDARYKGLEAKDSEKDARDSLNRRQEIRDNNRKLHDFRESTQAAKATTDSSIIRNI